MTENNNKQQADKQPAEDIWLNVRVNPDSGLLETEAYGNPRNLAVLMGAALARIAHEGTSDPHAFIFQTMSIITDAALSILEAMEKQERGENNG